MVKVKIEKIEKKIPLCDNCIHKSIIRNYCLKRKEENPSYDNCNFFEQKDYYVVEFGNIVCGITKEECDVCSNKTMVLQTNWFNNIESEYICFNCLQKLVEVLKKIYVEISVKQ